MSSYSQPPIESQLSATPNGRPGAITARRPVHTQWIRAQKGVSKLSMLTAYDYPTAKLLDEAGVDILLVGDSLGTVLYGEPNTLSVTLDDVIRHTVAVTRAVAPTGSSPGRAFVVADLPFMTYQISPEQALVSSGRLLKEARAQAVKLEGGREMAETVRRLTLAGIPVMGHIGLTPQSIHAQGIYRMHGKTSTEADYLLDSARALCEAGCFSLVLECVEPELAARITRELSIPTIGIGSGDETDGQVLVVHDLMGLTSGRVPKFVQPLAALGDQMRDAARAYVARVQGRPATAHTSENSIPSQSSSHSPSQQPAQQLAQPSATPASSRDALSH